jgi:hypothetical protein
MTTVTAKTIRCRECRKRWRGQDSWNVDYVAGMAAGYLCPDCQTTDQDLEAQVNAVLNPPTQWRGVPLRNGNFGRFIESLLRLYPTAAVMRSRADVLAGSRNDQAATERVRLMRTIADDMEAGHL